MVDPLVLEEFTGGLNPLALPGEQHGGGKVDILGSIPTGWR